MLGARSSPGADCCCSGPRRLKATWRSSAHRCRGCFWKVRGRNEPAPRSPTWIKRVSTGRPGPEIRLAKGQKPNGCLLPRFPRIKKTSGGS